MRYLLDTNIISETGKPRPNKGVIDWLSKQQRKNVYLSVATFGEIEKGIVLVENKNQQTILKDWVESHIQSSYKENILDVNMEVSRVWGRFLAIDENNSIDALIAATAATYGLILVTRNTKHFKPYNVPMINPFDNTI